MAQNQNGGIAEILRRAVKREIAAFRQRNETDFRKTTSLLVDNLRRITSTRLLNEETFSSFIPRDLQMQNGEERERNSDDGELWEIPMNPDAIELASDYDGNSKDGEASTYQGNNTRTHSDSTTVNSSSIIRQNSSYNTRSRTREVDHSSNPLFQVRSSDDLQNQHEASRTDSSRENQQQSPSTTATTTTRHPVLFKTKRGWKCQVCGKYFSSKCSVQRHQRAIHFPSPSDPTFCCSICSKAFRIKSVCQKHEARVHTDARLYTCAICSKAYKYETSLTRHRKICAVIP